MVYDVYVWGKLIATYKSLNKANAALYRHDPRGFSRVVSFVKARAACGRLNFAHGFLHLSDAGDRV